jgi:virginiamycin A acetyltransferase
MSNYSKTLSQEMLNETTLNNLQKRLIYIHPESRIRVPSFNIGFGSRINGPILIKGNDKVSIGKFCAFGEYIIIRSSNHDMSKPNMNIYLHNIFGFCSLSTSKGPISIGNVVWLGDDVKILTGVSIGNGAVVGAGSVVTKSIPPYAVAAGNPAKVIHYRFSQSIIDQLEKIQWWNWPLQKIRINKRFFETDLTNNPELDLYSLIFDP